MRYGPPVAEYLAGAAWLDEFMRAHGLSTEGTSHVLGVNQARVWEWLRQRREFPEDARRRLERWAADGCPRFPYWEEYPYRHFGRVASSGDAA